MDESLKILLVYFRLLDKDVITLSIFLNIVGICLYILPYPFGISGIVIWCVAYISLFYAGFDIYVKNRQSHPKIIREKCKIIIMDFQIEWNNEKNRNPDNLNRIKEILSRLQDSINRIKVEILGNISKEQDNTFDAINKKIFELRDYRIRYYNSNSYKDFWMQGGNLLELLNQLIGLIK
jgi:hypothetical protein